MIIQAASILLLVCLSLKINNDHLNLPPRSDHGSITHYRPLCTINSCTDLVSVRMHLDKLRHSHLAPSHTKPIHSMQLVLIILCGDISSNPGPVHPCGVCNRAVTNKCPAIQCDNCNTWIHNTCSGITNSRYDTYIASPNLTFICPQCNLSTFLQHISSILNLHSSTNRFDILSTSGSSTSLPSTSTYSLPSINSPQQFRPAPNATSSPKQKPGNLTQIANKVRVMSVNCNSIQSLDKRSELSALIDLHNPHIILGQESKIGPVHQSSEIFPQNYTSFRKDRKVGGGGVFVLVKDDINSLECTFEDLTDNDCEIVWAQIRLPGSKLLNIASIYRPPNSSLQTMNKINQNLTTVFSKFRNATYILAGDLNLSCIDWQTETLISNPINGTNDTNHCSSFLDTMNELGLSQHCNDITRPASGKTLDLILTNIPDTVVEVTSSPGMSDHNVVIAKFNLITSRKRQPQRTILKFNQTNWDDIREGAEAITSKYLSRNPESFSVQENGAYIETELRTLIDRHIPTKLSKTKHSYPWITPSIRNLQRKRDRHYVQAIKTRAPEHWHKFKQIRKQCKDSITTSHKTYLKEMFNEKDLKANPKPFRTYIKSLRKENQGIPTLQTPSGIPAATNISKANTLVNQFTSVFTKEITETLPNLHSVHPEMPKISFGLEGIAKLLSNINHTKAAGPDKLPARLLKETAHQIAPMCTHLFSQSYQHGLLPDSWTRSTVCPIFKKGNRSLPENYRPISLTAIPCKLFEHIIVSKIWDHLNKHNIITNRQHGFRKGMSCETQLIEALHDWTEIMNQGQGQIDVILLDFSKAFDTVPHQRLLHKLKSYGITHHTLNWINAFLTNRTHQVLVNGSHSETQIVTSGVPQGTVLGPLLFLLYINDIENNLTSKIRLFADDSALYRKIDTLADSHSLQQDILRLQDWADKWQMKFNIKKCKLLRITKTIIRFKYLMHTPTSPSNTRHPQQTSTAADNFLNLDNSLSSNSIVLDEVKSDKYLGVILDNKLSFNQHIDEIVNKTLKPMQTKPTHVRSSY